MTQNAPEYQWIHSDGAAFGRPGLSPRWTSSEKDAVCTAYSASSRVWFTVSHGVVNEMYYPTIDRPQVRDLGFLVSDGQTFFHEDKRDLHHVFSYTDSNTLGVHVESHDPRDRYVLVKDIIANPHHSAVLVHVRVEAGENGDDTFLSGLKVYALLAPHLEVGGANNSGRALDCGGKRVLLAWKGDMSLAMSASCGFGRVSCGFVGASDGWTDLNQNFKMDWEFDQAIDGNIALMGEIDLKRTREFTVAVGFGEGHHGALVAAMQSLATPFPFHLERFAKQWHRVVFPVDLNSSQDHGRLLRISHNTLLAHEDKRFQGAFIASASIPWGQSKGDDDLGGYHLVWTRDMVQSATALMALGKRDTPLRALVYLMCTQRPDGGFSQNFWVNGTPYWSGMQLDEVAFPIILAWRLWKRNALANVNILPFVERAAAYLMKFAPITQQERWEEVAGYSPSTLAAVITGLVCASEIVEAHDGAGRGDLYTSVADWLEANLDRWTTTDDGVLLPGVRRHYIRVRPPGPGEPFFDSSIPEGHVGLANRGPNEKAIFEAREIVDAGFLSLVRFGIRAADDPLIVDSLKVIDAVLKVQTPYGPCWRRYNHDGYGQKHDGGPYDGWGQGRAWPILTGERGHYELASGHDPRPFIAAMEKFASRGGMLPEQIWDAPDLPVRGMFFGRPSGSAMPLAWAHAEYIKLLRSAEDGKIFDCVDAVAKRYLNGRRDRPIEIARRGHLPERVAPGKTLRVLESSQFDLVWTMDEWKTSNTLPSKNIGDGVAFADIPIPGNAHGNISFTMRWQPEDRWEGKNFDVPIGG